MGDIADYFIDGMERGFAPSGTYDKTKRRYEMNQNYGTTQGNDAMLDALYKKAHVVTEKVRLSYCHVFQKYADPKNRTAQPQYSVVVILPKTDLATKQRIDEAQQAAAEIGRLKKWGGVIPPNLQTVIWDGDGIRQNGKPFGPECRGCWVFTAGNKNQPPEVYDENRNPVIDQSIIYSGIYARVSIDFYPFNQGKNGIGCSLNRIQKLADGESLGGSRGSVDEDFGGFPGGGPAMNQGFPGQIASFPGQTATTLNFQQPMQGYGSPAPALPGMNQPTNFSPGFPSQSFNQAAGQPIPGQPIPGQPFNQFTGQAPVMGVAGQPFPGQPIPGQPFPGQPIPGQR